MQELEELLKARISLERAAWKAALILAHNLCAQYSDRHNANDETEQAQALSDMCPRLRAYVDASDEELAEMIAEASLA